MFTPIDRHPRLARSLDQPDRRPWQTEMHNENNVSTRGYGTNARERHLTIGDEVLINQERLERIACRRICQTGPSHAALIMPSNSYLIAGWWVRIIGSKTDSSP